MLLFLACFGHNNLRNASQAYKKETSTIFLLPHGSRQGSKISPLQLENNYEMFEIYYFQFARWKLLMPLESYIKFLL